MGSQSKFCKSICVQALKSSLMVFVFILSLQIKGNCQTYDTTWAPPGSQWYYENKGYDSAKIKHIKVDWKRFIYLKDADSVIRKYSELKFSYLDKNDSALMPDSLYLYAPQVIYTFLKNDTVNVFYGKYYNWKLFHFTTNRSLQKVWMGGRAGFSYYDFGVDSFYCSAVNGLTLKNMRCRALYKSGAVHKISSRIGMQPYFFPTDSMGQNLYGGKLLWYYDPQFGKYEPGITPELPCTSGIEDNVQIPLSLHIYPNPFADELNIRPPGAGIISLFDISGRLLMREFVEEGVSALDQKDLAAGCYFLEFRGKETVLRSKIVKSK